MTASKYKPQERSLAISEMARQETQPLPVLLIGHGSRDSDGRQALLDLAAAFVEVDRRRPVIPCFLELTEPTIADGVAECDRLGYTDVVALPVLLFGARHNKFDITNELDALHRHYPHITFHYGAPLGITHSLLSELKQSLAAAEQALSPVDKADTSLLFVGRGSSDPDANSEACKLARLVWEGSGYQSVDVCFIGITHPRLEVGFDRTLMMNPKRILVLPYFLFTGVLVKKIQAAAAARNAAQAETEIVCLSELGISPAVLQSLYEREREAQLGHIQMNCQLCKFRIAASDSVGSAHQHHSHYHGHNHHSHGHHHHTAATDPYAQESDYHQRIWTVP
ncbi:MAG: sirohydrochlorin chelatase [Cyanobacteria bacterium P01_E01_bin.34]